MVIDGVCWRAVLAIFCLSAWCTPVAGQVVQLDRAQWIHADAGPQPVRLPFVWDRVAGNRSGVAHLQLDWAVEALPARPMALFLPKAGNAVELRVNGSLLMRLGSLEQANSSDFGKLPQWVVVPGELVRRDNVIDIKLRADEGRRAGLAPIFAGPLDEIESIYRWRHMDRFTLTVLILGLTLGVSLLAFSLAWTQRELTHPDDVRNRWIFLVAGVTEASWSLRLSDQIWVDPPLPWPVWSVVSSAAYLAWIAGALVFSHHACALRLPALRQVVVIFVTLGLLSALLSRLLAWPWAWTAWMGVTAVGLIAYGHWFSWTLLGRRTYLDALVALAALANIGAGAWMWWVFRWQSDPMGAGSSQRYTSILFTSALLLILLQRFRLASVRARENIDLLDRQVALKEQELAQVYRSQEQWAREQATQQERQRIWRDLHDGLGAHLNTALRQLQSDRVDPNSLRDTLQDGLFQLKLSVDAANLPLGDLGVLLGSLRYRLAPRLQAAGLTLHWEVDALPRLPQLESPQALRELQFIVYEALANVLQHSRARSLLVRARREAGGVVLLIRDDGPLESGVSSPGRGLRSMHERALALGIELAISHGQSGTQVRLFIALH